MLKVSELFDVRYGVNLELNNLQLNSFGINFVSRTSQNNGVSAKVNKIPSLTPIPSGTISVACGGSVMESFLQPEPYYSGRDLFYLTPKTSLSVEQKLFYCNCLRANKYKYNYGRQANRTLKDIIIPDPDSIPSWVNKVNISTLNNFKQRITKNKNFELNTITWLSFTYDNIFSINRGEAYYKKDMVLGNYPYISASSKNNGVTAFVNRSNFKGNKISLSYDGSIGEAFYQKEDFFASEKIAILDIKNHKLTPFIAMFIIPLLRHEKFRYNYGLKWSIESRMKKSIIKLPVKNKIPDWQFMEYYVKSLPFSFQLL